jgi:hypothetical protein
MNIGLSIGVSSTKHNVDSFSPKSFGSVTAWFDAKQQHAARGSSVTQINDYSGNAKHATQTTAANQAIIGPDGWFRFDGVNDYYNFGTVNANTVFAVARFDTVGKVNTVISKGYGLDINNLRNNSSVYPSPGNGNDLQAINNSGVYTSAGIWVNEGNSLTIAANYPHVVSAYVGDTDKAFGCIGIGYTGDNARWMQGSIAELIFFNEQLNATNRIAVERYLLKKWGISYRA